MTESTSPSQVTEQEAAEAIRSIIEPSVLDIVHEFVSRFVWLPGEEMDALSVWIIHSWVFKAFYATPRLIARGPKGTGKSTVLKLVAALSRNGARCSNASMPSVYTLIEQENPTLVFDEVDRWLTRTSGYTSGQRGELVGILNDGYTEDAFVFRQIDRVTHRYPVFVVAAFGGIGRQPETLEDRSVILDMEKKPKHVHLRQWDPKKYGAEAKEIYRVLEGWARSRGPELDPEPSIPDEIGENREFQIWAPLISIGDLEGTAWGQRIRDAALKLACGISKKPKQSPAEQLIIAVADNTREDGFMPSSEFIQYLVVLRDNGECIPWAKWLDDPIAAARQLASILRPYGIESEQKWLNGENRRGYSMGAFHMWAERLRDR